MQFFTIREWQMMQEKVGTNLKRVLTQRVYCTPICLHTPFPHPQLQDPSWAGVPLLMPLTFRVLDWMDGGEEARPIPAW